MFYHLNLKEIIMHAIAPTQPSPWLPRYHKPISTVSALALGVFSFIKLYQHTLSPWKASLGAVILTVVTYKVMEFAMSFLVKKPSTESLPNKTVSHSENNSDEFDMLDGETPTKAPSAPHEQNSATTGFVFPDTMLGKPVTEKQA
jgi:hypothetical protein